ncbi:MAG TPA: adenylate/guanylate cyclase domain-containing protein [Candidatus Polarisedimenticolaceae bacterium]|nr:adenylate/guanylate cyclase domain-containing protein [Candidatus Polarisedimenticolaceae bacterium]
MRPETFYAKAGDVSVAYQNFGSGPDLVICPGWVSNVEYGWEIPERAAFHDELARFVRVTIFDKRGTGLSDREVGAATLEERIDDLRAVMDASGIARAHVFAVSEGGSLSLLFAATYPERVRSLTLFGCFACRTRQHDYPWAPTPEERQTFYDAIAHRWHADMDIATIAPSMAGDPAARRRLATYFRMSASPRGALALARLNTEIDVRHVLPAIRVPTLVLHREHDADARVEEGRYVADHIPGARLVVLPGADHLPYAGDTGPVVDEVRAFVTGVRERAQADRILATLLFTDIVGSTAQAAKLGDRAWRARLERHYAAVDRHVRTYRGQRVKFMGDGALAVFDGPGRALRCARALVADPGAPEIALRAGVHTGEVERMGEDVGGIAVHVAARVAAEAEGGEVLATNTVRELCAGSGLAFEDRGLRTLPSFSEPWRLFAVSPRPA